MQRRSVDSLFPGRWHVKCPVTPDGWLFRNPSTLLPYWQEAVAAQQIKPAAIRAKHTFRHTYRTWLQAAGVPMPIQKELMRHASIQTTMNVYGRSLMSEAKREANSNVVRMGAEADLGCQKQKEPVGSLLICSFLHLEGRVATLGK